MVVPFSAFLSPSIGAPQSKPGPFLNNQPNYISTTASKYAGYNRPQKNLMRSYKETPELLAPVQIVVTDILGDSPIFEGLDHRPLQRDKLLEAEKFWRDNRMKEICKSWLTEGIITGDGYLWQGKPSKRQVDSATKEAVKTFAQSAGLNDLQTKELLLEVKSDEISVTPKKIDYVAATTVEILSDYFDVIGYEQSANGYTKRFSPEEIIHFRYEMVDGQVHGFSPVKSLATEIALLKHVKMNMLAYMENGGNPDKLFIMKTTRSNSDDYARFVEQLKSYKTMQNRHGNMVMTGEADVKELNTGVRDLEYKDLALYICSNVAYVLKVPVTRLPFLIGASATKGDSGGMADSGYWKMISEKQDMIEDLLNSQLFEKMGFAIRFPRGYKQDTVRESQTWQFNIDSLQKIESMLQQRGLQLTQEKIMEVLSGGSTSIHEEDVEPLSPEKQGMMDAELESMNRQNQMDNQSVSKEPDNRKKADTRRKAANSKQTKGLVS